MARRLRSGWAFAAGRTQWRTRRHGLSAELTRPRAVCPGQASDEGLNWIMIGLSTQTHEILRGAGWFPGRHVDTAAWDSSFVETGLMMPPAAAAFLGEFGGLGFDIAATGSSHPW